MNRVKSGIPGLDDLMEGGFPESSSILISGSAGSGKSILCLEYLYNGAKLYNEPGVYITLEEGPHNLWWNMQRFKWDLLPLERANLLKIYKFEPTANMKDDAEVQIQRIVEKAKAMQAKRLVIDSITAFSFWIDDVAKIRYAVYVLIEELRKINCTTLLTCETTGKKNDISRFGVEEFLTDGVVQLFFLPPHRSVFVRKMRGTNHDKNVHTMDINESGLSIDSKSEILWEAIKD
ncbi:MAG: ATPase domain-containing protein [Candidatus Micrarchaeota archaeon]